MKDVNLLQDLQGLSNETYNKILRLAEKHGKERKDKWPKKPTRRTFGFGFDDDEAISKVTKYNKWLKKKKSLVQRAVEEDWKGPVFDIKFTSFKAVEAIQEMISQTKVINQAHNVSKNLQEEKWALKVALAHNYYMTCMLWREIANFVMKKKIGLTTIITNKYINISDYSIKKLQRCAAHGLIFKHFPLLVLSGVTANQLNEYRTMFINDLGHGSLNAHFWSSVPQHLLDETHKHIKLAFQGFLYKCKFEIAHSSVTNKSINEAVHAFSTLKFPDQEIWKEMIKVDDKKQQVPSPLFVLLFTNLW